MSRIRKSRKSTASAARKNIDNNRGRAHIATDEKAKSNAFSFYEDHIRVHFDKPKEDEDSVPGTKIAGKLENYDITDLKLPATLFSNDCVYNKITAEIIGEDGVKYLTSVNMGYRTNEISGRAAITKYCSKEIIAPIDFLNTTEKSKTEELSVNGLTVYVVEQNDFSSITYLDDLTQYMIYFETDFDSVVEIAKTITTANATITKTHIYTALLMGSRFFIHRRAFVKLHGRCKYSAQQKKSAHKKPWAGFVL